MRSRIAQTLLLACAALAAWCLASNAQELPADHQVFETPGRQAHVIVEKELDLRGADDAATRSMRLAVLNAAGLKHVSEHSSFDVFKGALRLAESALETLRLVDVGARLAPELDSVTIAGSKYDPRTGMPLSGQAMPELHPVGESGLYVLTFDSFPSPLWLTAVADLGVTLLDPLPPASYIVFCDRNTIKSLASTADYVLGAFPLSPEIKTAAVAAPTDGSVYRPFVIDVIELSPAQSIAPFLESVAAGGLYHESDRQGLRVQYTARLSDVDLTVLSAFESVFTISSAAGAEISSEREGGLLRLAEPSWSLPSTAPSPSYSGWLSGKGLGSFPNTTVGLVDTGFDTTGLGNHPDFTLTGAASGTPFVATTYLIGGGVQRNFSQSPGANVDDISHGTIATSIVSGYQPDSTDRKDANGYRFALGVAPKVNTVVDKFFSRSGVYATLPVDFTIVYNRLGEALQILKFNGHANVINHSWNDQDGVTGCRYKDISQLLDKKTRTDNMLYVVSAGNTFSGCPYVRAPANAKNAIAVGATEVQTPNWANKANLIPGQGTVTECNWNDYPVSPTPGLDPRNMPSFSGRARDVANVLLKPDLVASGLRITGPLSRDLAWQGDNGVFCNRDVASFPAVGVTYGVSAGTSFSAPAVSGGAAVVRQWYRNSLAGSDPSPAMAKAILINGARDTQGGLFRKIVTNNNVGIVGYIPDQFQGWGMLSFARLLNSAASYYWFDQGFTFVGGGATTWTVSKPVVSTAVPSRITLVYTDRFSSTLNTDQYKVVNDLDLKVCNAGNTACWYGNRLVNGTSEQRTPSNPYSDAINNVEEVIIPAGVVTAGQQLVVTVTARSLMSDAIDPGNPAGVNPRQDFAIFATNIH